MVGKVKVLLRYWNDKIQPLKLRNAVYIGTPGGRSQLLKSQLSLILNTKVSWLNTHSATALDTGKQRQDKAYLATSELSARMPTVLPIQKWNIAI